MTLPALTRLGRLAVPEQAELTLPGGLTVIAVRRPGAALVELRLWVPFARVAPASSAVLAQSLFSGTGERSGTGLASALQRVGGMLSAQADPDRLLVTGSALGTELDELLALLAEVLAGAAYPDGEVGTARERFADRLRIRLRRPTQRVLMALRERIYEGHPYATQIPRLPDVLGVHPEDLRALHARRVVPGEAFLVLVGDHDPDDALAVAARRLGGWTGAGAGERLPRIPAPVPGAALLVDSPAAVQSSLRVALPAVRRGHPDNAALQLANLIFGGYFSSRWTQNLREDKGYTYSPSSVIEHALAGSTLVAAAEVATAVTGPALAETLRELEKIAGEPPAEAEVEQAREYALGSLVLGMSTQSGLTRLAGNLAGHGLRLDYLAAHADGLAAASAGDVFRAAATYLTPARAVIVLLGDAARVAAEVGAVVPAAVRGADGHIASENGEKRD
ncbi:M16 family metallopeptidase [Sphaerisporangium aureirubrum]|uniref:M16 family metallopeptidase n=1 Tax=Sphaerisporangium aureirubrum TaxID=1544736 RepID=A0ABW1NUK0_9ACTN